MRHRSACWSLCGLAACDVLCVCAGPTVVPAASAAGGGMGLPVIAGAAVGGLALVAIGVVMLRRRRTVKPCRRRRLGLACMCWWALSVK
jgi:hypothetical protein